MDAHGTELALARDKDSSSVGNSDSDLEEKTVNSASVRPVDEKDALSSVIPCSIKLSHSVPDEAAELLEDPEADNDMLAQGTAANMVLGSELEPISEAASSKERESRDQPVRRSRFDNKDFRRFAVKTLDPSFSHEPINGIACNLSVSPERSFKGLSRVKSAEVLRVARLLKNSL